MTLWKTAVWHLGSWTPSLLPPDPGLLDTSSIPSGTSLSPRRTPYILSPFCTCPPDLTWHPLGSCLLPPDCTPGARQRRPLQPDRQGAESGHLLQIILLLTKVWQHATIIILCRGLHAKEYYGIEEPWVKVIFKRKILNKCISHG